MTMDLVEFLRARLDEDEQIARVASGRREGQSSDGEHWRWEHVHDDKPVDLDEADEMGFAFGVSLRSVEHYPAYSGIGDLPHFAVKQADEQEVRAARHIARHDPARVLAEVDAKRRIINDYLDVGVSGPWNGGYAQALVEALRLLALPYANHDDYQEEWKP